MGGANSRAFVTPSPEAVGLLSKKAGKDRSKSLPVTKDNPQPRTEQKSPGRRRKQSKKAAASGQEDAGKLGTFVREGVTNFSKTLRDWRMVGTRGSKSAAPLISTEKRRTSRHFNFHHESYLAQTRQEKPSAVDFSLPRHLNSVTKQPLQDYTIPRGRQCPDHIPPPPRRVPYTKDSSTFFHSGKSQNPSYLYSLELKHGSNEHCPYVTDCAQDHVITMYRARSSAIRDLSGEESFAMDTSCEWSTPVVNGDGSKKVPVFLAAQDVVVQRVEVEPTMEYDMIKSKTIRVNGVEYVKKKSDHPLMRQLLSRDKSKMKRGQVVREKPERDKEDRSRQGTTADTVEVKTTEHSVLKERTKTADKGRQNPKEHDVDEIQRKEFMLKEKDKMNAPKISCDGVKTTVTSNVDKQKTKEQFYELALAKRQTSKQDIVKGKSPLNKDSEKTEIEYKVKNDAPKVQEKKDVSRDNKFTTKILEKKENEIHEFQTNIGSKECKNANNSVVSHRYKDGKESEGKTMSVKKVDDGDNAEKKTIATIERDMMKQCKIQAKPVTVCSTGRLYLHSMKYLPTPIATMHEQAASVSACASEQSYSRLSHASPSRGRAATTRRTLANMEGGDAPEMRQPSPPRAVIANEEQRSVKELKTALQLKSDRFVMYGSKPLRHEGRGRVESPQRNADKDEKVQKVEQPPDPTKASQPKRNNPERCKEPVLQRESHGRRSPSPSPQRVMIPAAPPNIGATEDVEKRLSHNSTEVWHTRSVRSKNRMFEGIIERTGSVATSPRHHCRESRNSSPNSQKSDTPFSKAIKSRYRAISAKRIAKVYQVSDSALESPQVFTPWDSCIMFKAIPTHPDITHRRRTRRRSPHSKAIQEETPRGMGSPTWGEDSPSDVEESPLTPRFPRETYRAMQGVGHSGDGKKITDKNDCVLEHCNCATVRTAKGKGTNQPTLSYSKLNWEAVQDFERKFRTTHIFRSVMGEACGLRGGTSSCKENHGKTPPPPLTRPTPRCSDCGDPLVEFEEEERCCQCGDRLEGAAGDGRDKEDKHKQVSTQGSSSGLSAKSGQVLPYKKLIGNQGDATCVQALRMFEKKTRKIAESAARQWRPQSPGRPSERVRSRSRGRRTAEEGINKAVERRTPRLESERRAHRTPREEAERGEAGGDPHFNRSEQELFRNARMQWMARDRQRRARQPPPQIRSVVHVTSPSTVVKGILKKSKTLGSMEEDYRWCRR